MNNLTASHVRWMSPGDANPPDGLSDSQKVDFYVFRARQMRAEAVADALKALGKTFLRPFRPIRTALSW